VVLFDLDVIQQNVEVAVDHVETGANELEKAVSHQASTRRKLVFAVIIGLAIIVLLIIIVYSSKK
jgi:t-SNARE complex subunit (syntaxin)